MTDVGEVMNECISVEFESLKISIVRWPLGSDSITVTSQWAWWRLKSPASRLLTELFIKAQIK